MLINKGNCIYNLLKRFAYKYFIRFIPDSIWISLRFRRRMGSWPNLRNPKTFNEKLQWLKLHDRNPLYTKMVDKYEVKKIVAEKIGEEYVIPTLGVWDKFEDVDFDKLSDQFVLKCTHDSGGLVFVRDKAMLDMNTARKKLINCLKMNCYWSMREWPYKNVKPRIIAEPYMKDKNNDNLPVFKIFNFSGSPRIIQAIQNDKTPHESIDYFDTEWNRLDMKTNYPNSKIPFEKPSHLTEMLALSKKLSAGFPFIRIDLYEINDKIYFSEYTFYTDAGCVPYSPQKWDYELGNLVKLQDKESMA